ncbi:outer membrane beta-barrel protein [Hymenobacter sp. P5342]|uniref:Outer membrane beta-barrel protein n=2 Tax=Hymenobacter lapidiphilus TaxID=2608003 RepID=A0A7Y7PT91_9BACT|nr:outer membrane beta-barrel protein [Hymenobacter lapidiphilus]
MSLGKHVVAKVALVLLCGHSTARGQAPDSTGLKGRWYAGAGVASHKYFTLNGPTSQIRPAYVSAGYYLTPRVALQAELQYGQRTQQSNGGESVIDGETFSVRTKERIKSTALTVLLRYSGRRPQRPLQLDWLLGVAVVHGRSSETITRTSPTRSQSYTSPTRDLTEPHLVAGLGLRYQLGPHVAVGAQAVVNKNLRILPYGGFGMILGSGANLGVTYLFGPTKP